MRRALLGRADPIVQGGPQFLFVKPRLHVHDDAGLVQDECRVGRIAQGMLYLVLQGVAQPGHLGT